MSELRKNIGEVKKELRERRELLKRIDRCLESDELNDWEEEFLDDIHDRVDSNTYSEDGGILSKAQLNKLSEIEDIVEGGRYEQ